MKRWTMLSAVVILALAGCLSTGPNEPEVCDLLLRGGRVIDPESGTDAVADVHVRGGRIVAVGDPKSGACEVVDVTGLVVAPGFIDLHVHGQDAVSRDFMARDGVTTALELEAGTKHIGRFIERSRGSARIHYGASAGHILARVFVKHGVSGDAIDVLALGGSEWMTEPASPDEIDAIIASLSEDLDAGALGIGVGIAYTPAADASELRAIFELAAERRAVVFVHMRGQRDPLDVAPLAEVLEHAEATGARLHVVHINSSSAAAIETNLASLDAARARGVDVTTEVYPYASASTYIETAIFDEGWRARRGAGYGDLQWVATGERLTTETFAKYRLVGGPVILHVMDPAWIRRAIAHPEVMVASDGMPMLPGAHPRGAGTHARVLARYVRDEGVLTLNEAIAKMSLLPARLLEARAPAMRRKGRVQPGADADLVIFDPRNVQDRASFEDPLQPSAGIDHVLVNGVFVVRDGALVDGSYPGIGLVARP